MWTLFEPLHDWWCTRQMRRITPERVRERVRRGAAYLDDADARWYRRVNPDTLALESGQHCVLGQLHGEFRLGLGRSNVLSLSSGPQASLSPVAYGFKCTQHVPPGWQNREYELLTVAWRDAVQRRRAGDVPGDGDEGAPTLTINEEDPEEDAAVPAV